MEVSLNMFVFYSSDLTFIPDIAVHLRVCEWERYTD